MTKNEYKVKDFPHPYVTVDVLIFSIVRGELSTLVIKRSNAPYEGKFALPGGFVAMDESLDQAVRRVVKMKTGIEKLYFEQLYSFGDINRDPRGRVISVTYLALIPDGEERVVRDEKHVVSWCGVGRLSELAFDHNAIIETGINRLKSKLGYSNIAVGLMPEKFGLGELQKVYEIILGRALDKRNFRKKILALGLLKEAGEKSGGRYRPAKLYSFESVKPVFFK